MWARDHCGPGPHAKENRFVFHSFYAGAITFKNSKEKKQKNFSQNSERSQCGLGGSVRYTYKIETPIWQDGRKTEATLAQEVFKKVCDNSRNTGHVLAHNSAAKARTEVRRGQKESSDLDLADGRGPSAVRAHRERVMRVQRLKHHTKSMKNHVF